MPQVGLDVEQELEQERYQHQAVHHPQADHDEDHLEEDEITGARGKQHPHHTQDSGEGTLQSTHTVAKTSRFSEMLQTSSYYN